MLLLVIANLRTMYVVARKEKSVASYRAALKETYKLDVKGGIAKGLGLGILYFVLYLCWSLLLWYTSHLVHKGIVNGGEAFTTMLNVVISSMYVQPSGLLDRQPLILQPLQRQQLQHIQFSRPSTKQKSLKKKSMRRKVWRSNQCSKTLTLKMLVSDTRLGQMFPLLRMSISKFLLAMLLPLWTVVDRVKALLFHSLRDSMNRL